MSLNNNQRELLGRGSEEIVPSLEEATEALDSDNSAYVGFEPSGRLHLGHMLTAQKLKDLENIGMETTVLLADEHAYLNGKPSDVPHEKARDTISQVADMYEVALDAFGLDADIVRGTEFQLDNREYSKAVNDIQRTVPENRLDAAVADVASGDSRSGGQLLYPAMQVADMYHLDVDVAVGGIDQRAIHMLARDFQPLGRDESDKPVAVHTPIIGVNVGDGEKMSSSGSAIEIYAEKDQIEEEVNSMYLSPQASQIVDEYDIEASETVEDEKEMIYNASPVLQLIDHYALMRDEDFEIERPDKYGGDVSYDSRDRLLEDIRDGELHPADVKSGLSDLIFESFEGPRKAVLDSGLHEPVEELYED